MAIEVIGIDQVQIRVGDLARFSGAGGRRCAAG